MFSVSLVIVYVFFNCVCFLLIVYVIVNCVCFCRVCMLFVKYVCLYWLVAGYLAVENGDTSRRQQ